MALLAPDGTFQEWLYDSLALAARAAPGQLLECLVDPDSQVKAQLMAGSLAAGEVVFDWELVLALDDQLTVCHLWGVPAEEGILLIGALTRDEMRALARDLIETGNPCLAPWNELLRRSMAMAEQPSIEDSLYEELTRTNNELTNLQRELAKANAELSLAVEQLDAFAHSVSHDLRTPLMHIRGFVDVLVEDYGTRLDGDGQQVLAWIAEDTARMAAMIDDILAYSRLSRAEFALARIDTASVVREAERQVFGAAARDACVAIDTPMAWVMGHRPNLVQMVANLLSNARKYTKPDQAPEIRVWTEVCGRRGRRVRLWVQDHGVGIAPEHHERIFGLFGRVNRRDETEGTGVGLAIVRAGAERMGGSVGVESQVGVGSRFWIELERAEEPSP